MVATRRSDPDLPGLRYGTDTFVSSDLGLQGKDASSAALVENVNLTTGALDVAAVSNGSRCGDGLGGGSGGGSGTGRWGFRQQ